MTLIRLGKGEMNNGVIMFAKMGKEIEKRVKKNFGRF